MTETVEYGAALAWRLLATLEGGSVLLGASALLAYTARNRLLRRRPIRNVLITNTENTLGKELKQQLELHGCKVFVANDALCDMTSDATRDATSDATRDETHNKIHDDGVDKVDALIVVGGDLRNNNLDGMADMMTQDVYRNLKLLESLCVRVRRGGCVSWACTGVTRGAFGGATGAYDAVLLAALRHVANVAECELVWVGRCVDAEQAVQRTLSALILCTTNDSLSSIRHAALKLSGYICRWLKIIN